MHEQSANSNYRAPTFAQATEAIEKLEEIKQALELGTRLAGYAPGSLAMAQASGFTMTAGGTSLPASPRETIPLSAMLRRQQESYVARYISDIIGFIFFGSQLNLSAYYWSKTDMKFTYRWSGDPSGLGPDDQDVTLTLKVSGHVTDGLRLLGRRRERICQTRRIRSPARHGSSI